MSIRQATATREDPRQRRSRRRLSEALLSLVAERNYRDISVVDICQRAMVHRTTFYAHFEDKDALFRYVLEEELAEAAKNRPPRPAESGGGSFRNNLKEELAVALRFCTSHRNIYLTGMAGGGYAEMRAIEEHLSRRIEKIVQDAYPGGSLYMAAMTGRFYAGSLMNVVQWWMVNNIPIGEEELLELMSRLLPESWETK